MLMKMLHTDTLLAELHQAKPPEPIQIMRGECGSEAGNPGTKTMTNYEFSFIFKNDAPGIHGAAHDGTDPNEALNLFSQ